MSKELVNYTGKGFRSRYSTGTHTVDLYFGESLVYSWPVARNELEVGSGNDEYPQYRIDAFMAKRLGDMLRKLDNLEEDPTFGEEFEL